MHKRTHGSPHTLPLQSKKEHAVDLSHHSSALKSATAHTLCSHFASCLSPGGLKMCLKMLKLFSKGKLVHTLVFGSPCLPFYRLRECSTTTILPVSGSALFELSQFYIGQFLRRPALLRPIWFFDVDGKTPTWTNTLFQPRSRIFHDLGQLWPCSTNLAKQYG